MMNLSELVQEGERIATYYIHSEYVTRNALIPEGSTDVSGALEMTLHRILDAGGTEDDVYSIMGAIIPTEEDRKGLEKFNEFVEIDLGYVLPGVILLWT